LFVFAFRAVSVAQGSFDIDFGVRGGISGVGPPLEVSNNHYFPNHYSTSVAPRYTFGATLGIRLNKHFEVRLEASRSRFQFSGASGTPFPASGYKSTWTTTGRVWQYPFLVTYHSDLGGVDFFWGGGASPGVSIKGTTYAETTTVVSYTPLETTTTTSASSLRTYASPIPFYGTAGFSKRLSFLSVRPQLRLTFWSAYTSSNPAYQDNSVLFPSVTPEFLIGISVHPFHLKK
jgi:hypothetical protein